MCILFFFFSSRRRHTRFDCDWSSDVCSSDLESRLGQSDIPEAPRFGARVLQKGSHTVEERGLAEECFRSEEHTSELQSQSNLVCRLLLEKKKNDNIRSPTYDNTRDTPWQRAT